MRTDIDTILNGSALVSKYAIKPRQLKVSIASLVHTNLLGPRLSEFVGRISSELLLPETTRPLEYIPSSDKHPP